MQPTVGQPMPTQQMMGGAGMVGPGGNTVIMIQGAGGPVPDEGRLEEFAYVHAMGRSIKCFAIIDCCLVLFYALNSWLFLALLPLPLIGYWGASKYNKMLVMVYGAFIIFATIGRVVILIYSDSLFYQLLMVLVIICEIYIFRIVTRFVQAIWSYTDEEKQMLEHGMLPARAMVWY